MKSNNNKKIGKTEKQNVIIITKQSISAKDSLFPEKLKKVNKMLENVVMMKH